MLREEVELKHYNNDDICLCNNIHTYIIYIVQFFI